MKKNIHIMVMLFTICSVSFLWTGCSSDENNFDNSSLSGKGDYSGDPVLIKATVGGVENFNGKTTLTRSGATSPKAVFVQPLDESKDTGFDIETSIEPLTDIVTRADVIMPKVFFRVLAYKNNKVSVNNFAGQGDFMTEEDGTANAIVNRELSLAEGSYLFVCYSYYTDNIPDPLDPTDVTVPVLQSQDFMVCQIKGTVADDGTGAYTLPDIVFRRLGCKLQLEVNVSGFPKDIVNACAATVNNLNDDEVKWTIGDAILPQKGTSGSLDFNFTLNANAAISNSQIVLSASKRDLRITFTRLTIAGQSYDSTVVSIPEKELAAAGNYKVKMNIKQNYILINGYKWAKGNLYKEGENYLFEATQEAFHAGVNDGGYFGFNTLSSTNGTFSKNLYYSYDTDPCSKAKPAGTWQTPTKIITETLLESFVFSPEKKGALFGEGDNILFLPYAGVRLDTDGGKIAGIDNYAYYGLQDENTTAYYYTFLLSKDKPEYMDYTHRRWGSPIRCVKINK